MGHGRQKAGVMTGYIVYFVLPYLVENRIGGIRHKHIGQGLIPDAHA